MYEFSKYVGLDTQKDTMAMARQRQPCLVDTSKSSAILATFYKLQGTSLFISQAFTVHHGRFSLHQSPGLPHSRRLRSVLQK